MTVEQIAQLAHETNRAYCAILGDDSQVPWSDAPEWQRDSAMNGVRLHLENPNAGPDDSHKSWYAEKEAAGWVFGPVKDATLKTHPCMVPYEQLPVEQQVKDYLFRGIVHACARTTEAATPA